MKKFLGSHLSSCRTPFFAMIPLSLLLCIAGGCTSPDGGPGGAAAAAGIKPETVADQVGRINNNTHMPPAAKADALGRMRASYQQRGLPIPPELKETGSKP